MKYRIIGWVIGIVILVPIVIILHLNGNNDDKQQIPPIVYEQEPEIESVKDVYVTDNLNDENSSIVTEPSTAVSFWYVYFHASVKSGESIFDGYKVIQISHPYFDVNEARLKLVSTATDADYVGVTFFKRVPLETYNAYITTEKP